MPSSRPLPDADFDAMVDTLDLETKVRLLSGAGVWTTAAAKEVGLRSMTLSDGPVGVRGGHDSELDPSAALPSGSAMAATWDEDLLERIGGLLAAEAVRKGVDVGVGQRTGRGHDSPVQGAAGWPRCRGPPRTCEWRGAPGSFLRGWERAPRGGRR